MSRTASSTLSVIIITKNEEHNIAECLKSVSFADEIIVVDSGSTDNTCGIAESLGAQVTITADWPGFGPQKNRALSLATKEWVLSIDADERVTPELAHEIQQLLVSSPQHEAYKIARLSNFCGRWMRHSGWWPDHVLRLFKRGSTKFTDDIVHESVKETNSLGTLSGHFLHYPYPNLESLIDKVNRYSTDGANKMLAKGRRTGVAGIITHSVWTFIRIYFL